MGEPEKLIVPPKHMTPAGGEESIRKALHEIVDELDYADLYSMGDKVIHGRQKRLDEDHYVYVMIAMNKIPPELKEKWFPKI